MDNTANIKEKVKVVLDQLQVPEEIIQEAMSQIPDEVTTVEEATEIVISVLEGSTLIDSDDIQKRVRDHLGNDLSGVKNSVDQYIT